LTIKLRPRLLPAAGAAAITAVPLLGALQDRIRQQRGLTGKTLPAVLATVGVVVTIRAVAAVIRRVAAIRAVVGKEEERPRVQLLMLKLLQTIRPKLKTRTLRKPVSREPVAAD
jgi:hypothetical protein